MSIKLVTEVNLRSKHQKMKIKPCQFPKCKAEFLGRGKTKYCDEHRKKKYKKYLYQRAGNDVGEANVVIKHKHIKASKMIRVCGLMGCDHKYEITLIPNQTIYTKYCLEHRNKYKREFFIKKDKNNEI